MNWAAAFASGDPARQWAASCSVAKVMTSGDRWRDSTALYEAAVGAFDAAVRDAAGSPVAAAVVGARRAAYWERQARVRLVPPVSYGEHRWGCDVRVGQGCGQLLEPISEETLKR